MSIIRRIVKVLPRLSSRGPGFAERRTTAVIEPPLEHAPVSSPDHRELRIGWSSELADPFLVTRIEDQGIDLSTINVGRLYLSVRASKRLSAAGIDTIQQLLTCTESYLLSIDGLGATTLEEIKQKLGSCLASLISSDGQDLATRDTSGKMSQPLLPLDLEQQCAPPDKVGVQVLGLSEQELNELRMFNINTIQDLINCDRNGFLDLHMTTGQEIREKVYAYLTSLSPEPNRHSRTAGTSEAIAQPSSLPASPRSVHERRPAGLQLGIADPLLVARIKGEGFDLHATRVGWLDLGVRASRRLSIANIDNLQQLADCTQGDLLSLDGLGITTLQEIEDKLDGYLHRILHELPLREQREAQLEKIYDQLLELVGQLCGPFEEHVPLDEIPLPYSAQPSLRKVIGEKPETVADLRRLTGLHGHQVSTPLRMEQMSTQIKALEQAVYQLSKVLTYQSIDYEVSAMIHHLDDRERFILTSRFGIHSCLTLEVVGEQFQITRERVRQLESRMRDKLTKHLKKSSLMYSAAGIALLKHLGEDETIDSWIQGLINIGFLKKEAAANLLVALSRIVNTPPLTLPDGFKQMLEPRLPPHVVLAKKPIVGRARKLCRNCGAIRVGSLTNEKVSEADVEQILRSDGFTEVSPGWWMRGVGDCVPERVARKVIAWCGPISPSTLRQALTKHLSRFRLPAPPSEALVKVLESTGNFVLVDGFLELTRTPTRKPGLTKPELIFVRTLQAEGPILSFESIHAGVTQEGLSRPSVTSLLRYSPIVEKVAFGLYTLLGTQYKIEDVERAKSHLTKVPANTSVKPRPDGVIEFETNVGTWMVYGGVLSAGRVASLEGHWTLLADDMVKRDLVIGRGLIRGLSEVVVSLGLMPMDRIRIEFNTWTREAKAVRVADKGADHEEAC